MESAQILTISQSEGSVCASYTCPRNSGSMMIVSSDSNSDLLAWWPETYDTLALITIEALAGLSGAKGEPHGCLDKESKTMLAFLGL